MNLSDFRDYIRLLRYVETPQPFPTGGPHAQVQLVHRRGFRSQPFAAPVLITARSDRQGVSEREHKECRVGEQFQD